LKGHYDYRTAKNEDKRNMKAITKAVRKREETEKRRVLWYPLEWDKAIIEKSQSKGLTVTEWIRKIIKRNLRK